MHNLRLEGSGKLIVKRNGVVRAEKADDNMLLNGFYTKLILQQPHLELKAAAKVGMGYDAGVGSMTALQTGLQPTSGLWPTAFLTPDGVAQLIDGKLVVKGFFNFTFEPGQIVGPLVEYGIDLSGNTRPDMFDVDTRLVIMSGADLPLPMQITAQDQVLISYKITLTIDLVQPSKTISVDYDGTPVQHQVKLNISKVGDIIDYINILGSKPSAATTDILVSPETPTAPLVPFLPTTVSNVGEAVLKVSDTGAYVPITIGAGTEFPGGIQTITFSDSWYQMVFTPPIVKSSHQVVKMTIGQGLETISAPETGVVGKVKQPEFRWAFPSGGAELGMPMPMLGVPTAENDELQIIINDTNDNLLSGGYADTLVAETGKFHALKIDPNQNWGFHVGVAFGQIKEPFLSKTEIFAKYDFFLDIAASTGTAKIQLAPGEWGAIKALDVADPFNPVDGNVTVGVSDIRQNGNYVGSGVHLFVGTVANEFFGVPVTSFSDFYGRPIPEAAPFMLLGNLEYSFRVQPKADNPNAPITLNLNSYICGDISQTGGWLHDQSLGKYLTAKAFNSDNISVVSDDDLQIAVSAYKETQGSESQSTLIFNGNYTSTTLNSLDRVRIDLGVAGNTGRFTTADLLDLLDIYVVAQTEGYPGTSITLKAVKNLTGEIKYHTVRGAGDHNPIPENLEYTQLIPGKVFNAGFYIDDWFARVVGDLSNNPKLKHGKRQVGTFCFTVYVKPKAGVPMRAVINAKKIRIS